MLRITHDDTAGEERWTLCGQLSGPWVAELCSTWKRRHDAANSTRCVVDLSDVTAIDERGEELLRRMKEQGARLVARGVDMKHIVDHLNSTEPRPLRRFLAYLSDCS